MKRVAVFVGAIVVAAFGVTAVVYSYVSPGIALEDIKEAARQNDKERLRELIDFNSVKTGLKEDIKSIILVSAGESLKDNPFAAFGIAIATMMVDPLVESIVSPSGLTAMMTKGAIEPAQSGTRIIPTVSSIQETSSSDGIDTERGYQGFSRYRIRIKRTGTSAEVLVLTLSREGLFSWKLSSVSLPADLIPKLQQDQSAAIAQPVRTQPILIAHVAPLTGAISHLGKDNENGARLAIEEANETKIKIEGKDAKFVLVAEDDQADPRVGTRVAQKLVDAKVSGVVGHLNSGTSIPASFIYNQAGIPVITGSATNPKLTEQGFEVQFRVIGRDDQQGPGLAKYILSVQNPKLVAVVEDGTAYGEGIANEFERTVRAANIKVLPRQRGTDRTTNWRRVLAKLDDSRPDVIFYGGMDSTAAPLVRQARELGIKAVFSFGDGACTHDMTKLAGAAADGLLCSQAGLPPQAADRKFLDAYKKRFNADPILFAPFTYDAANMLIDAMKKANSADPAKYLPELAKLEYSGSTGKIAFDAKGDRKDAEMTIFTMKGGKLEPIAIVKGDKTIRYEAYLGTVDGR